VAPQIVFTGEPTSYTISFLGHKAPRPEGKPPPPVDMIFVVDVSGSMSDSLSDMVQAARTVAHELTTTKTHGQIRFALTVFDSNNNIKTTLNDDINSFYAELNNLTIDGGSNISTAFAPINQLLSQARPHAAKTVVFYTDGYVFLSRQYR
jgi:Mg-chelatase subunit ChlD